MSGIVGIVNLDGAPVDQALLWAMTRRLTYRGPDAQHVWFEGSAGFGHTLLRTAVGQKQQPYTFDGRKTIICADARLDSRADLRQSLTAAGCAVMPAASDAELILYAYQVWGEACSEHLLGDFAFAIWDAPVRRLFCARDQLGVRPFFYAHVAGALIFSNDLRCIRLHPGVSSELNETAIADFLLFEQNLDTDATAFAAIRRLPPASVLTAQQDDVRLRRYWTLAPTETLRYRNPADYLEQFMTLFRQAISDRIDDQTVGVMMSGGLDSTSIAAVAKELLAGHGGVSLLTAYTLVYDRLIPDQERHFAEIAAHAIGIPIRYQALDDYALFDGWQDPDLSGMCLPEPADISLRCRSLDFVERIWQGERVMLSGFGGDPLLYPEPTHLARRLRRGEIVRVGREMIQYVRRFRRPPPLYLRSWLRDRAFGASRKEGEPFPAWIQPAWARRLNLHDRWKRFNAEMELPPDVGPTERPTAYRQLSITLWPTVFETYDCAQLGGAYEVRHPFFDLRLARFLLALPPLPWCVDKSLLREAMKGYLPPEVRLRPKAPLAGAPLHQPATFVNRQWVKSQLTDLAKLEECVIIENVLKYDVTSSAQHFEQHLSYLRIFGLAYWLRCCQC